MLVDSCQCSVLKMDVEQTRSACEDRSGRSCSAAHITLERLKGERRACHIAKPSGSASHGLVPDLNAQLDKP